LIYKIGLLSLIVCVINIKT